MATPIGLGVKRTRLSEVSSIRGPVAACYSLCGSRHQQRTKAPVTRIAGGLCYMLHSLYYICSCYVHLLLKTGTTWLCMVAFLASRKNAFFAPCLCQRETSQVGTLVRFQAMSEKDEICKRTRRKDVRPERDALSNRPRTKNLS